MTAIRQRQTKFGGHDAAAAVGGITGNADVHRWKTSRGFSTLFQMPCQ
jgi:hypothetical protein